ncbi:hypothetical protein [Alcanivorax sp.]|uniref:hypothetical protein n=1 Tax=Alcanivorax sp. TaxID=1872427 RepID=UPI000C0EE81F|nr:hypothetical protein [Alcanivorax sp.]PHR67958.1 MAG: hypothetical protein COA55_03535 [Alcanivorax sp.]
MTARRKPAQKPEEKPEEQQTAANDDGQPEKERETENKTYDAIDAAIADEEGKAKEGEWQPGQGAANDDKPEDTVGVQEIKALTQMAFAVAAARFGPHWNLSNDEAQGLAEAGDAVAQKYLGNVTMGPEAALCITAGMIILPRVVLTLNQPEKPEPKPEKTGTEGGQGGD